MVDTINPDVNWDSFIYNTKPILFFDGYCHLCQASVQYVLKHERAAELLFAPLDSNTAKQILPKNFSSESVVLYYKGSIYTHSTAAIMLSLYLKAPYRYLYIFKYIPRTIRDAVYKWIAKHRYKWFGKSETCMLPNSNVKNRFLN